jgi:hypothetical protein
MTADLVPVEPLEPSKPKRERRPIGAFALVVAALFGLVYAYLVWQAIRNLIELPKSYIAFGYTSDDVPWWLLIIGLIIPILIYVVAFLAGLNQNLLSKAVLFFVGLTASSGLAFGVFAVHKLTVQALQLAQLN